MKKFRQVFAIAIFAMVFSFGFAPVAFAQKQFVSLDLRGFPDASQAEQKITSYYKTSGAIIFVDENDPLRQRLLRVSAESLQIREESKVDYRIRKSNQKAEEMIRYYNAAYDEAVNLANRWIRNDFARRAAIEATYTKFHNLAEAARASIQPEHYDELTVLAPVTVEWINPKSGIVVDRAKGRVLGNFERRYIREDGSYVVVASDSLASYGIPKGKVLEQQDRNLEWLLELAFLEAAKNPKNQTIGRTTGR